MDENKSFNFYVGDAANRVDKTLRISQVTIESSPWYLRSVRFYGFVIFGLKYLL